MMTKQKGIVIGVGLVVALLLGLYFNGNLDRTLYPVGLNFDECARNGFGATFCGSELDQYRAKVQRVKEAGEETQRKISALQTEGKQRQEALEQREAEERAARHRKLEEQVTPQKKAEAEASPNGSVARIEYESARQQLQAE
jgi:hypothetical protein